ncbi:MAG: hypothetical protein RLY43_1600 [Bacteroidota bacterium]
MNLKELAELLKKRQLDYYDVNPQLQQNISKHTYNQIISNISDKDIILCYMVDNETKKFISSTDYEYLCEQIDRNRINSYDDFADCCTIGKKRWSSELPHPKG